MTDDPTTAGAPARSEPQTFRARDLTASLTVDDLEKSLAWYRDIVGFTVAQTHERDGSLGAVSLVAGAIRLVLTQDDGAKGRDRVKGQGMSLMITTAQDVDELAARIRERGGTLKSEPEDTRWGSRLFRLEDPDGFTLAIGTEPD